MYITFFQAVHAYLNAKLEEDGTAAVGEGGGSYNGDVKGCPRAGNCLQNKNFMWGIVWKFETREEYPLYINI